MRIQQCKLVSLKASKRRENYRMDLFHILKVKLFHKQIISETIKERRKRKRKLLNERKSWRLEEKKKKKKIRKLDHGAIYYFFTSVQLFRFHALRSIITIL